MQVHITHDSLMGAVEMESQTSLKGKKKKSYNPSFPSFTLTNKTEISLGAACKSCCLALRSPVLSVDQSLCPAFVLCDE